MKSNQTLSDSATTRPPIRLELAHVGAAPVVHIHEAAPLVITDRTCQTSGGWTLRAWRKIARAMSDAGYATTTTADGITALRADVEQWLRTRAPRVESEPAAPAPMSDSALLSRMRGAKR